MTLESNIDRVLLAGKTQAPRLRRRFLHWWCGKEHGNGWVSAACECGPRHNFCVPRAEARAGMRCRHKEAGEPACGMPVKFYHEGKEYIPPAGGKKRHLRGWRKKARAAAVMYDTYMRQADHGYDLQVTYEPSLLGWVANLYHDGKWNGSSATFPTPAAAMKGGDEILAHASHFAVAGGKRRKARR